MTTTKAILAIESPADPQTRNKFENVRQLAAEPVARGAARPTGLTLWSVSPTPGSKGPARNRYLRIYRANDTG